MIAIITIIAATWCYANEMWSVADWKLPSAYVGPFRGPSKSDVLLHLALIRAARDGHFVPLQSKIVPELGAPGEGNWNDWPITEELPIFAIGLLARIVGIFAALNIALLSCHLLAGLTFYCVARYRGANIGWSFAAAIVFGLASYIFSQSPDHVLVALCWHVPLFIVVWDQFFDDKTSTSRLKQFWFGIGVAILTGLQMPYYAAIFAQLVLLSALISFARTRNSYRLVLGVVLLGATGITFALMNLDTWLYQWRFGPNPDALVRPYQWLEVYGLKLVDLITPPLNHHWQVFRNFADWRMHAQILHDEGSYFGLLGIAALLLLCTVAISALLADKHQEVPNGFWQVLWVFVFFTTGGLNAVFGLAGFTFLRASCRFSVVILVIALLFSSQWLSRHCRKLFVVLLAPVIVTAIAIADQVPMKASAEQKATIARQILSDRKFVADIEEVLPSGAMIFNLPIMDFPEAPLQNLSAYDHLRPYLYSTHLRFSFGNVKGRDPGNWQKSLLARPWADAIYEIEQHGFSAIYINQSAYSREIPPLRQVFTELGYSKIIDSDNGDLTCVILN